MKKQILLTVNGADLVAHGESDQLVSLVVHDKDLIDAELLARWYGAQDLLMWTALKFNALCPQVAPRVNAPVGHVDGVVPS